MSLKRTIGIGVALLISAVAHAAPTTQPANTDDFYWVAYGSGPTFTLAQEAAKKEMQNCIPAGKLAKVLSTGQTKGKKSFDYSIRYKLIDDPLSAWPRSNLLTYFGYGDNEAAAIADAKARIKEPENRSDVDFQVESKQSWRLPDGRFVCRIDVLPIEDAPWQPPVHPPLKEGEKAITCTDATPRDSLATALIRLRLDIPRGKSYVRTYQHQYKQPDGLWVAVIHYRIAEGSERTAHDYQDEKIIADTPPRQVRRSARVSR